MKGLRMHNSEFERRVQQKTEGLKIVPSEGLWDKIEGQLPPEKKRRRALLWLLPLLLLTGGAGWWFAANKQSNATDKQPSKATAIQSATNGQHTIVQDTRHMAASATQTLPNAAIKDVATPSQPVQQDYHISVTATQPDSNQRRAQGNKKMSVAQQMPVRTRPATAWAIATNTVNDKQDDRKLPPSHNGNKAGQIKTKIAAADATIEPAIDPDADATMLSKQHIPIKPMVAFKNSVTQQIELAQWYFIGPTDAADNKVQKKNAKKNWTFGLTAGIGMSWRNDKLFSASDEKQLQMMTFGGSITGIVFDSSKSNAISKHQAGLSFHMGVYAQRPIGNRWILQTGLVYNYLSNRQPAGKEYLSFNNNSYLSLGNGAYTNRIHLVQVPITLQYQLGSQHTWNLLMGTSLGYLAASNLLVYDANGQSPIYVKGTDLYNRIQATAHIGASVRPQPSAALTLGMRVEYGITSLTKKTFDAQRMMAAQVFCQIPFSKK